MKDNFNILQNGRQPELFKNGRQPNFFLSKWKTTGKPKLILGLAKLSKIFHKCSDEM
jgi:hypothetical protein